MPIKRHRWSDWIEKQDPTICCLQETKFMFKDINGLRIKGLQKIYHGGSNHKRDRIAIMTSDKTDFMPRNITRDKEGYFIKVLKGHDLIISVIFTAS